MTVNLKTRDSRVLSTTVLHPEYSDAHLYSRPGKPCLTTAVLQIVFKVNTCTCTGAIALFHEFQAILRSSMELITPYTTVFEFLNPVEKIVYMGRIRIRFVAGMRVDYREKLFGKSNRLITKVPEIV